MTPRKSGRWTRFGHSRPSGTSSPSFPFPRPATILHGEGEDAAEAAVRQPGACHEGNRGGPTWSLRLPALKS